MPVDHKRINGPEDTLPYELFAKKNKQTLSESFEEILKNGIRKDSRSFHEHRKIFIKTGVVSQAKGSAYIEMEKSKVIVSVFDPREIPNRSDYSLKGEIYCEFKFAPFSCKKRRLHQLDTEEKQYSVIMKQALESTVCRHEFPNFQSWMHTGVDVGMEFFKLYFGNVSPSKIPAWYQNEIQCTSKSQIQSEFGDAVNLIT